MSDPPSVLVVEDEALISMLAEEVLRSAGFTVCLAGSAETALVQFHRRAFDAAVVDLNLPGMSGEELIRVLRWIEPALPIVVSTGYLRGQQPRPGAPGIRLPANVQVVEKPWPEDALHAAVRDAIRTRTSVRDAGRDDAPENPTGV